jgi:hypothetical protein
MSSRRLTASYKLDVVALGLTAPEIAVYRWLSWRMNKDTGRCDPSHQDIANGTGYKVSAVRTALYSLKGRGLVDWKGRAKDGRGRTSNSYTLDLTASAEIRSGSDLTPGDAIRSPDLTVSDDRASLGRRQGPSSGDDEEPKDRNLKDEPKAAGAAVSQHPEDPDYEDLIGRIFSFWASATKQPKAKLSPKRRAAIDRAFGHYEPEEVEEAIGNWRHSPFHRGDNKTGKRFNDLADLLRDDDTIEELRAAGSRLRGVGA